MSALDDECDELACVRLCRCEDVERSREQERESWKQEMSEKDVEMTSLTGQLAEMESTVAGL